MKQQILNQLKEILIKDEDSMNPEILFKNIKNSSGDVDFLAKIFSVPSYLIKQIQNCDE